MVATVNMLSRNQVIAYVGQHAAEHGLDAAAVLAVANHEGLNKPGGKWWLPGENNWSFGPPSWYGNGAGAAILKQFGGDSDKAAAWAWSPDGLNYWLASVGQSARGLTGIDAIRAIVTGFERPRADLVPGEISNASKDYAMFQQAIGSVQVPTLPGQTVAPGEDTATSPVQGAGTTTATGAGGGGLLAAGQVGPFSLGVPSGLLLGLIAVLLLIIGAIIMSGTERIKQVTAT